jgi:pimeloyl-ACP methyl ester carboxylesterase
LLDDRGIGSNHYSISLPQSKEIVPTDTLKQQFNVAQDWFATNWGGVCVQLSKVSIPTLVMTETEDIPAPAANSLIIAQKIPGAWLVHIKGAGHGHGLMHQYPEIFGKVLQTFLTTKTTLPSN